MIAVSKTVKLSVRMQLLRISSRDMRASSVMSSTDSTEERQHTGPPTCTSPTGCIESYSGPYHTGLPSALHGPGFGSSTKFSGPGPTYCGPGPGLG